MSNQNSTNTGNSTNTSSKDVFSTWKQTSDKYMDAVEKVIPSYHQSVTSLQQEYIQACENAIDSTIEFQRKFANKTGINTNVPEATLKAVRDTNEQVIKSFDVQSKMALATVDAARQNVQTFANNAKAFAELNNNVMQSWTSAFTQTRN
jgi:sugar-specific transcriptional regulator TrmB